MRWVLWFSHWGSLVFNMLVVSSGYCISVPLKSAYFILSYVVPCALYSFRNSKCFRELRYSMFGWYPGGWSL